LSRTARVGEDRRHDHIPPLDPVSAALVPVDVLGGSVRLAGILEVEATVEGIVLHRMPEWARTRHNDIALSLLETMPSGARIEMLTDAATLELDVHLTMVQVGSMSWPAPCFDLVVDGALGQPRTTRTGTLIRVDEQTGAVDFEPGGPVTIRFDDLPPGQKLVEVWLPQNAAVRLIELRADGAVRPPVPTDARRWVHYGSSISHCGEAARPTGVWPVVAARRAGVDLQSFAFAGQCQLDPFAGRMIAAQPVDLVSLKLGINVVNGDTMRERAFFPAVHGLLDAIRERHPEVPIVLITPIVCPAVEDDPGPTRSVDGTFAAVARPPELAVGALSLRRIRELETEIVTARRSTDPNLHLLSGLDLFGPGDVDDLPDGLHPNAAGYQRMGDRFHAWAFEAGPFAAP
jgi:hypothetical protein